MIDKVLAIDAAKETERITSFIGRIARRASAKGVVVGLSGGVDSAVVGALCVRALGRRKVIALLMPSDHTPDEDMRDAQVLVDAWNVRAETVPISKIAGAIAASAKLNGTKIAHANIEARARMTILYYYANSLSYLVAGTGDRSESLLGYFCYDAETRVVTAEGPKGMNELKAGDMVFSLEPVSRRMFETRVEKVFIFDYDGRLIHFHGKGIDLKVTPNHRMLVQTTSSNADSPARFRPAADCMKFKRTLVPLASKWRGSEELPLALEVRFEQRQLKRTVQLAIEDALYLFGLFLGDGCAVKTRVVVPVKSALSRLEYSKMPRDKSGRYVLLPSSAQEPRMKEYEEFETDFALPDYTKEGARNRLIGILEKYKIGYSLTRDLVRIPSKGIYELFVQCGIGARNKHIPPWLMQYPSEHLVWLLRGLKDSDASHAENQNVYYTSSERLKDDFVQLCFKLGRRATASVRGPRKSVINGKSFITGKSYEISFPRKPRSQHSFSNRIAKKVNYVGKVWCPSVPPYENILVERNGRYMFSGNTKFGDGGVDFLPIAHLYKTQVRALGAFLGLPKAVVEKPASPQLWPGHKASDEIPAEYDKLDILLYYMFDLKKAPEYASFKAGLPTFVTDKVLEMHRKTEHKRSLPPSLNSV